MRLEGKVALIGGGARGMGAAEARMLAWEGARVAIGDVLEDEGARVEAEIAEAGGGSIVNISSTGAWSVARSPLCIRRQRVRYVSWPKPQPSSMRRTGSEPTPCIRAQSIRVCWPRCTRTPRRDGTESPAYRLEGWGRWTR